MDYKSARVYHEHLVSEFRKIPKTPETQNLWSKASIINKMQQIFNDFLLEGIRKQDEPFPQLPAQAVHIPEWTPEAVELEDDGA